MLTYSVCGTNRDALSSFIINRGGSMTYSTDPQDDLPFFNNQINTEVKSLPQQRSKEWSGQYP